MLKAEKILYRGIWNKYQREYHYSKGEYHDTCCERIVFLEKVLSELTNGELNDAVFTSWANSINYVR